MSSLRRTLLRWLLGAVLVVGLVGGWLIYRNSLAQANAFFDFHLRATALLLRDQAYGYSGAPGLPRDVPEYDFVVQVWTVDGRRVYASDPAVRLPDRVTLGFSTEATADGRFRTYSVIARDYVIQVGQRLSERESRAARLAFRTLLPFGLLMPVLALLIGWIVNRSLAPLGAFATRLRERSPADFSPLATTGLPREVVPLVDALNDLLGRLATSIEHERSFIADAAHELRTPLTALRLQLETLATAAASPDRELAASQLGTGVERASRLVEQLLSLARHERRDAAAPVAVDVEAVVRSVIEELLPIADRRRIDLGLDAAPVAKAAADADALGVLVRNLVDNALRYTPTGGRVDVRVRTDERRPGGVVIDVIDDGPGIPSAERERVFDRFYRVPGTTTTGSGIGLAIVRVIADRLGATVELGDGAGGKGLHVRVRLPAAGA